MSGVLGSLDRDLAAKQAAKYDPQREAEARTWIETVTGEKIGGNFHESLKNGQLLCKLATKVSGDVIKFNNSSMPFKQMENINLFLGAMDKLGCPKSDQFQTVDLYEAKNMGQVVDAIFALSRNAEKKGYKGPLLGPRLADKHEVSFSDEQLNQGKAFIGGQMGFTGGANQSGMSYGARRQVDGGHDKGSSIPSMQTQGSIGGANASGVSYGARREIGGADQGKN